MKLPILNAAALAAICAAGLPAADPDLVKLVMPDAKILAGVNVDQAKASPFGLYVLSQIQAQGAQHLQQVTALTGFDPTRDVHELLIASNGVPGGHSGLVLARGNFDADKIQSAALAGGGSTTTYNGQTVILDPKQANAVTFLNATLAVAGDVASVKGAIDRQIASASFSSDLLNQLSSTEDAWGIAAAPLSSLKPPTNSTNPQGAAIQNALQSIQQTSGGVKFGDPITFTGQAQTDTAANANAIAGLLQFLVNMAQMQAPQNNPQAAAVLKSLQISSSGTSISVVASISESQAEQAFKIPPQGAAPQSLRRVPRQRQ